MDRTRIRIFCSFLGVLGVFFAENNTVFEKNRKKPKTGKNRFFKNKKPKTDVQKPNRFLETLAIVYTKPSHMDVAQRFDDISWIHLLSFD